MGLIERLFTLVFGGGNLIRDTAEVFRENAEAGAVRAAEAQAAALGQFGTEFRHGRPGFFDSVMDGLNRLPRPALALGTLGLFISAMVDPVWFAARMQGIALVPEPLWWLLGVIVSFYFGARHQAKSHAFQASLASTLAQAPAVARSIAALDAARTAAPGLDDPDTWDGEDNAALAEWRDGRGG